MSSSAKVPLVDSGSASPKTRSLVTLLTPQDYADPQPLRGCGPRDIGRYVWQRVGFFDNPLAEAGFVEYNFPNSMKVPCIGDFFFAIVPTAFWNFGSGYFFALNADGSFIFPNMVYAYFIFTAVMLVKCSLQLFWWCTGSLAAGKFTEKAAVVTVVLATVMFFFTIIEAQMALCVSVGSALRNMVADPTTCLVVTPNNSFAWNIWVVMFIFRVRLCFSLPLILFPAIMQPFAYMWNGIPSPDLVSMLICVVHGLLCVALLAIEETNARRRFRQRLTTEAAIHEADRAKRHVNALMLNLIPDELLQRLLSRERVADVQEASVIFSDVAEFTLWSSSRSAKEVIRMLSDMFIRMDAHLITHSMFKITTIGDAYWVCSGLPIPDPEHALNACLFGLKMLEVAAFVVKQHKISGIRVGIASGRAYGGIMDPKDVNYQLFGEVNEHAEHLEQTAPIGRVLVSEATFQHASVQGASQLSFTPMTKDDHASSPVGYLIDVAAESDRNPRLYSARSSAHTDRSVALLNVVAAAQQQRIELLELKAAQTAVDLEQVKLAASEESGCCACLTYVTPEVEEECKTFRREIFMTVASTVHYVNAARNVATGALMLVALTVGDESSMIWAIVCAAISLLLTIGLCLVGRSAWSIAPAVHMLVFAIDLNAGYAMIAMGPATFALSADNQYFMAWGLMSYFVLNLWAGAVFIPVIYNLVVIVLPMLIWWAVVTPESLAGPPIGFIVNIVVLSAMSAIVCAIVFVSRRPVGVDRYVLAVTQRRIADEYDTLTALLSRTLPLFVIPRLRIWLSNGRRDVIAHRFSLVGVCFMKRLNFAPGQLSWDAATTKEELAAQLDAAARYHIAVMKHVDAECQRGYDIVRVKVLGDVTMIAAGLMGGSALSLDNDAATGTQRSGRYTNRSKATAPRRGSVAGPLVVTGDLHGMTAAPSTLCESLAPLLRLAWAMCVDQTEGSSKTIAGVHVGPAAAGVIGDERLIYDVFGDTVNTAARTMQTTCAQGHKESKLFITSDVVAHLQTHGSERAPVGHGSRFDGPIDCTCVASTIAQGDETTVSYSRAPESRPMKGKGTMHVHEVVSVVQSVW